MSAIIVCSQNKKRLKLLADLAKRLGASVDVLTNTQAEDIRFGMQMRQEKTGKSVARKTIFEHLDQHMGA